LARFKLEAVIFRALNETGIDWPGSDEVYVTIHVPALGVSTRTQVFEDVDAGEITDIPLDQSCILPIAGVRGPAFPLNGGSDRWSCSRDGAPGPFSFTIVFRERDDLPPCFIGCVYEPGFGPGEEPGPIEGWDDLIGRHKVVYSMEELTGLQVGQVKQETVTLSPCTPTPDEPNKGCGGYEAEYQFTWRITRLPDAEPVVSPVTRLHDPRE
jgi:hypothetical protein